MSKTTKQAVSCEKHGKGKEDARRHIEILISSLPKGQAGEARHRCPYCIYEKGFADGLQHAADALREMLLLAARMDEVS